MGRTYESIVDNVREFLERQPLFFVATAPLSADGHVNVSPKGLRGTFAVVAPDQVAYLDLTGSGIETIAHLRENARITLMFCAFDGPPRIVRLAGRGEAVFPGDAGFDDLASRFPELDGIRSVIVVDVDRVADSCGYAVPRMEYVDDRDQLLTWAARKGDEGIAEYHRGRNAESIDGLPGLTRPG
jgi:Pyridoxamine 5'-phosphate oxidase